MKQIKNIFLPTSFIETDSKAPFRVRKVFAMATRFSTVHTNTSRKVNPPQFTPQLSPLTSREMLGTLLDLSQFRCLVYEIGIMVASTCKRCDRCLFNICSPPTLGIFHRKAKDGFKEHEMQRKMSPFHSLQRLT